jgi:hypothetical protein
MEAQTGQAAVMRPPCCVGKAGFGIGDVIESLHYLLTNQLLCHKRTTVIFGFSLSWREVYSFLAIQETWYGPIILSYTKTHGPFFCHSIKQIYSDFVYLLLKVPFKKGFYWFMIDIYGVLLWYFQVYIIVPWFGSSPPLLSLFPLSPS